MIEVKEEEVGNDDWNSQEMVKEDEITQHEEEPSQSSESSNDIPVNQDVQQDQINHIENTTTNGLEEDSIPPDQEQPIRELSCSYSDCILICRR